MEGEIYPNFEVPKTCQKSQIPKKVIKLQVNYPNFSNNGKNTNETFMLFFRVFKHFCDIPILSEFHME